MQVEVDVTCMYNNFGGHSLFSFGDTTTLKMYSPWSSKNLIDRNWLKKIKQVSVDVTCMYTNFGGRGLSGFGDTASLKNG